MFIIMCTRVLNPIFAIFLVFIAPRISQAKEQSIGSQAQQLSVFPYSIIQSELSNKLKIILVPIQGGGLASVRTVIRSGARDEYEAGHTGFAHFFEHMMFRGTEKFPQAAYEKIVESLGADANAYTSTDITVYQFDVIAADLEQVFEIESDRFMNLAYSKDVFKTEAGAVYGEYRKNRSNPLFSIYEAIHATAFQKHTYGHTTMGLEKDIKAMPKMFAYSRRFFSRYYRPDNAILIVAGDIDPNATLKLIEKYYSAWKPGYIAPKIKPEPAQSKERSVQVKYSGKTLPIVWIGYKGQRADPHNPSWVAETVLSDLAFGETSPIYRELKLEKQLVQSLFAGPAEERDPGLWSIIFTVKDKKHLQPTIERVNQEIIMYSESVVDESRLQAVKSNIKYRFLMDLDTPSSVAETLAKYAGIHGSAESIDALYRNLDALRPQDIQSAARKLFARHSRTIAILESQP